MVRAASGFSNIVELGAGTGAITQELVALQGTSLLVVEIDQALANVLRTRFPQASVCEMPASAVIGTISPDKAVAFVSSLPFKSLPEVPRRETIAAILSFLKNSPDSTLVQFTYGGSVPFDAPLSFVWEKAAFVWANVPCATVWTLKFKPNK